MDRRADCSLLPSARSFVRCEERSRRRLPGGRRGPRAAWLQQRPRPPARVTGPVARGWGRRPRVDGPAEQPVSHVASFEL